ncbi:hypothetical protein GGF50DRAFT_92322 [Schizophyllum commune]
MSVSPITRRTATIFDNPLFKPKTSSITIKAPNRSPIAEHRGLNSTAREAGTAHSHNVCEMSPAPGWRRRDHRPDLAKRKLEYETNIMSEDPRLDRFVDLCKIHHQRCRYYEAELTVTRVLTFNPMRLNVHHTRGSVRRMAKNYHGVLADFNSVLATNPRFKKTVSTIEQARPAACPPPKDADYYFPQTHGGCEDSVAQYLIDDKHTSTVPSWRFHNHNGCARGEKCTVSHAPDEKSARDAV